MKPITRVLLIPVLVATVLLPAISGDAAPAGDPRLKRALEKAELKFTETKDGDYKMLFSTEDERSQIVWAESNTEMIGDFEIREVWAAGWQGESLLKNNDLVRMLKENSATKIGAWELLEEDGTWYAVFTAKIPAETPAEELKSILGFVAAKADALEKDILESDDL